MFKHSLKHFQIPYKFVKKFHNQTSNSNLIKVNVTNKYGHMFEVSGEYNDTLFDIIKNNKTLESQLLKDCLECSCQGVMACSTCHVYVDEDWYKVINKPCESEQDMLDLAYEPSDYSKLGCQLKLKPHLNGINITIPNDKNNMF